MRNRGNKNRISKRRRGITWKGGGKENEEDKKRNFMLFI
jgi:hypothetical protein